MNNSPFFTIVIPTRNRCVLLEDSINSVLLQKFEDYNLIISDNHSIDNTSILLNRFDNNPKVMHTKPLVELNMLDHWEYATKKASGSFVILLTDRTVLVEGALQKLYAIICKYPNFNCYSYGTRGYSEELNKMLIRKTTGKSRVFKSEVMINNFIEKFYYTDESLDYCFPKTINSCYRNSYALKVREKIGSYFNVKGVITPDYSSFFINSIFNTSIYYYGGLIAISQGSSISNGGKFFNGKVNDYLSSVESDVTFKYLPSKMPFIYNVLYNDYTIIYNKLKVENQLSKDMIGYFKNLYYEYILKKDIIDDLLNSNIQNEFLKLRSKLKITETAFQKIERGVEVKYKSNVSKSNSKAHIPLIHLRDYLFNKYEKNSMVNKVFKFRFDSILDAAGFNLKEIGFHKKKWILLFS